MTDFKLIESKLEGWVGCATMKSSVLQTGDVFPVDTSIYSHERDLPTENGFSRVEAFKSLSPYFQAKPTEIWLVRPLADSIEIKLKQSAGAAARRVEEIGATLITGSKLVFKVPYVGAVITLQRDYYWMQYASYEAVLLGKDGFEDASEARRFESLFMEGGRLRLWREELYQNAPFIPKDIEGHFLGTDAGFVQVGFCLPGGRKGPARLGRVGSSGKAWEINWVPSELMGERSGHQLSTRAAEFLGRRKLGMGVSTPSRGEGTIWQWWHLEPGQLAPPPEEWEIVDPVEALQVAPVLTQVTRGGDSITIRATKTVPATLGGDCVGTLKGMVYTPPARIDDLLEYEPERCKTQISALLRSSGVPGVQVDHVALGSDARSTFIIFNAVATHYFKVSRAQDGLKLRLFYQPWEGDEAEVSASNIQWAILAGGGSVDSMGVFKPGNSSPFTTVLAIDTTDAKFWYFGVITIPCNLVTLDKALELLQ